MPRCIVRANGRPFTVKGRILRPQVNSTGRLHVNLHGLDGRERLANVHTLVLETFVGPRPQGMEACHANDDPTDNRLVNLRWDTHRSNTRDEVANGNHRNARKTECHRGHEFTPENTLIISGGRRNCRQCRRDAQRESITSRGDDYRRENRERQRAWRAKQPKPERPLYTEPCPVCKTEREPSRFKLCESCRERGRAATARYRARLSS